MIANLSGVPNTSFVPILWHIFDFEKSKLLAVPFAIVDRKGFFLRDTIPWTKNPEKQYTRIFYAVHFVKKQLAADAPFITLSEKKL